MMIPGSVLMVFFAARSRLMRIGHSFAPMRPSIRTSKQFCWTMTEPMAKGETIDGKREN